MHGRKGIVILAVALFAAAGAPGCGLFSPPKRTYEMTGDPALARSRAMAALYAATGDSNEVTRAKAVEATVDVLGGRGGELYIKALDDPSPKVRFAAAMAVGDLRYAPAKDRLLAMMNFKVPRAERHYSVYCGAIYALHRMGRSEHTSELGQLLVHEGGLVRANAAMVLGRLGERSAIVPLRTVCNKEDEGDDEGILVKLQALESMARLGDARSMATLESYAAGQFLGKKLVALRVLGELGSDRTVMVLRSVVESPYHQPQARALAAGSMARLGTVTDHAYELCLTSAGDPDGVMRTALGKAYNPLTAGPTMINMLRELSVISLGWMKRPHAVDVLVGLLDDENGGVRVAAAMSILRLLPTSSDPAGMTPREMNGE